MSNVFVTIATDVEVEAQKLLSWLGKGEGVIQKVAQAEPQALAAVGAVFGAVDTALGDASAAAAQSGVNIPLDVQTFNDLKAVWPAVKNFLASVGITIK